MYGKMQEYLRQTLAEIKEAGLYKEERLIESAQQAAITVKGKEVLNFCANNYLGLSNHPRLIKASQEMMNNRGYGMSSVRFICGTQDIHKELEAAVSDYFQTEDTILYAACFDANGGVFEPLFSEEDAIISDSLNHASIIDGVRLCKAKRYRYANADMKDLERCLQEAQAQRFRIVVTDGVFSMDGNVAPMDQICDLAEKYDALVMVDESHSAGVVGTTGHGVSELYKTHGRVDIYTGTLGKAFGGALGGFTTGRKEIIDLLRQRSKAKRYRYANADMKDLERCLQEAQAQRFRIVVTDGVFSMDGNVAPMDQICDLAEKYDALVMVDESHSAGVVGTTGHGVSELYKTHGRVDIYTGTLGKAFGGALGGFTTGRKEIIDLLRQRSRPYLFSNSLAPGIIGASLEVFKMLKESNALHDKLVENVNYFRDKMTAAGFDIKPTQSAICAVMLYDAKLSQIYAARMQEEGIYVTGFYYPVVPKDQARIRVQISAGHEKAHLDKCIAAFIKVGKELNVLKAE